ncbi:Fe-S cluster assembly protein SufD [Microbacterium sp. B35-04]|uniref:Fe-S cluster assembly protein SufD n=1 Tax=unclassified Microbacterium TaxID=2609290 RepID=UPI0013D11893|nr:MULTISPECIES: Fe-S cluster assembly protein SufD [unclassified Microbacterium]KAF2413753.1 Fe-S cluster assembly protein SufD [Microbacterium sp. B35-04]KAF2416609.1 Fe-S cluster assembly protein SufD [Microbacterium sp. B35-30]
MSPTTEAPTIPGAKGHTDGAGAFVPVQTRSERPWSFDPADFEVPTGREVNWKHTPIAKVQPLFADEAGPHGIIQVEVDAPAGLVQERLTVGTAPRGEVFRPEDLPSAIAWRQETEAPLLRIPAGAEYTEPIVVSLTGTGGLAHAHVVVEAQANSHATVVFRHSGTAHHAQNVEIIVREGAHLELVTVQRWDDDAVHVASHQARVERDATLRHVVVSFGGGVVRVNPTVELAGTGSRAELYGLSYADSGQHLESQVYLHHKGAETSGDVLYKSALQGAAARTVWIGDVLIGSDAVGTDSYEANRNLVLTEGARAESIPNLEIETGDIRGAGHASATGRFDDEQLFYLQARGIAEDEARRLVVLGFLAEIVQKIGVADLEAELFAAIEEELAKEAGR